MAMEEKVFTINLRRDYRNHARWRRGKRAAVEVRKFLVRHMKAEDIKIGSSINELLWKHGMQRPPAKIKITAVKDDEGVVKAELFGVEIPKEEPEAKKGKEKKAEEKKEEKAEEKPEKEEKEPEKKPEKPAKGDKKAEEKPVKEPKKEKPSKKKGQKPKK
ncbi:hypothetical protein A3K63_02520 [Candidatus Micrarchaeota archaeon RBG_16_49_10]|nr:MAG: hypothetical protein A3K63_02520 [Candidatus Micrarchaeota archaeon RBG_16_49_10]